MKTFLLAVLLSWLAVVPTVDAAALSEKTAQAEQYEGWALLQKGLSELTLEKGRSVSLLVTGQLGDKQENITGRLESDLKVDTAGNFKGTHFISYTMQEGGLAQEWRYHFKQYGEMEDGKLVVYHGNGLDWTKTVMTMPDKQASIAEKAQLQQQIADFVSNAEAAMEARIIRDEAGMIRLHLIPRMEAANASRQAAVVENCQTEPIENKGGFGLGQTPQALSELQVQPPALAMQAGVENEEIAMLVSLLEPLRTDNIDLYITVDRESGSIRQVEADLQKWARAQLNRFAKMQQETQNVPAFLPNSEKADVKLRVLLNIRDMEKPLTIETPYYIKNAAREVKLPNRVNGKQTPVFAPYHA